MWQVPRRLPLSGRMRLKVRNKVALERGKYNGKPNIATAKPSMNPFGTAENKIDEKTADCSIDHVKQSKLLVL